MIKPWIATSVIGAAAFGVYAPNVKPVVNPAVKPVGLQAHDSHASASLLGQFRTSLSTSLFLRADLYLHNGVEMRPLSDQEIKAGKTGVGSSDSETEKLHDDSKIVTIIPPKESDFRGITGDVERAIASFKDMKGHSHQNPTATLPLFRLMTWLDPQFVPGWTTGSFIILWDQRPGSVQKSLDFLQQGLEKNPKSIDILTQIAHCHLKISPKAGKNTRDYKSALPYLELARRTGLENLKVLSESELQAVKETYWKLVVSYRETGDYQTMSLAAQEGLQVFPDDGPLQQGLAESKRLLIGLKTAPNKLSLPAEAQFH